MPCRAVWLVAFAMALQMPLSAAAPWATTHGYDAQDPRNLSWVDEGFLALGGGGLTEDDVRWLHAQGFTAVMSLRGEHRNPETLMAGLGMETYWLEVEHGVELSLTQIEAMLSWIDAQEAAGGKVYLHCTLGWHRSAAVAMAWEMREHGWSLAEAAGHAIERRPGTVVRAPQALLEHEASLTGVPGLTVLLLSDTHRKDPGETMPIAIEVRKPDGEPAAGADVRLWTEESGIDAHAVTDAEGRVAFDYPAPHAFMDHLYAYASLDGYTDGADQHEIFYESPASTTRALSIEHTLRDDGLHVRVLRDGEPVRARLLADDGEGWSIALHVDAHGAILPTPEGGGTLALRAERWGDLTAKTQVVVPAGLAQPSGAVPHAPGDGSAASDAARTWPMVTVALALGLATAALVVGHSGRRHP